MKLARLLPLLALSACALLEPRVDDILAADTVLRETLAVARASAGDQKEALARAQRDFVSQSNALNRLRLAVLLATLAPPLRDDARASELLEPIADANAPGAGRVAALLAAQVAERQRLAREIDRTTKELERAVRERQAADKERDKREEALRQQVEALRAIERGILEREERSGKKPPPAKP